MVEKLFPDLFLKNNNWSNLWIKTYEVLHSSFLLFVISWELSKDIETILHTICFYLTQSFLKKQKEVWN